MRSHNIYEKGGAFFELAYGLRSATKWEYATCEIFLYDTPAFNSAYGLELPKFEHNESTNIRLGELQSAAYLAHSEFPPKSNN